MSMPTRQIDRVAVVGAGTMGAGIAAHLANAHREVELLDIVPDADAGSGKPEGSEARNRLAREAIAAMTDGRSAVYEDRVTELIRPGNVEDHMDRLGDVDWVVEAVPEQLEIKRETFDAIAEHVSDDAIVSSNTSGLSIADLLEGRPESFRRRFLVTHFFNPVRRMKLLELVAAEATNPAVVETVEKFGRDVLGKGIVFGTDTTNFVANRIGVHDQMVVLHERENFGLSFEDVDAILREPMGRPSSAVFKLLDIIGVDTVVHAAENCHASLTDDEDRELYRVPDALHEMVERGWVGRKAGQGFYRKTDEGIEALRVDSWEYELRDAKEWSSLREASGTAGERIRSIVVEGDDEAAEFARVVTLKTVAYAARRLGEIADDVVNIDRAMRWGFNWELGPFEIWDAVGVEWGIEQMQDREIPVPEWAERMAERGRETFYRCDGSDRLYYVPESDAYREVPEDSKRIEAATLRETQTPLLENDSATLHDMGDGVALADFHTKMNAVDDGIIELLYDAIEWVEERDWRGLVVGNDGDHFSAGADLEGLLGRAEAKRWEAVRDHSKWFQGLTQRLRYSMKPVVTAPHGYTLGGGAEIAMAGNVMVAHAELTIGFVETGVGLVPGAGGTLQLLRKVLEDRAEGAAGEPMPRIRRVFETIREGWTSESADGARRRGFLDAGDTVLMNRDHLLHAAKSRVEALAGSGYRPPLRRKFRLPGEDGVAVLDSEMYNRLEAGQITEHDRRIGQRIAEILCGGETGSREAVPEERILELARDAFVDLSKTDKSQERMRHMLEHGRPLRN
jgi:3-hydroxyacyl-CoA dehydrogenase